jgi:transposase
MLSYSKTAMERAMKVQGVISRAKAKKITGWQAAEKWRRDGLWKRRWMEKSKNDFPTQLGNPANPAGFPLSHSLGDCGRLTKTGHFICYEKGTFLMS